MSKLIVVDANLLRDAFKDPDTCKDAEPDDVKAAFRIVASALECKISFAYCKKMFTELSSGGFRSDGLLRPLFDNNKFVVEKKREISGGNYRDLTNYVNGDDAMYVLVAANIPSKTLISRDPKTSSERSIRYIKRKLGVTVLRAAEFELPT